MTADGRKRAFIAAAACVVLTACVLLLLPRGDDTPQAPSRMQPSAGVTLTTRETETPARSASPSRLVRGTEPPNPRQSRRARLAARRVAGRFIAAFVRFQGGPHDRALRREFAATASPRVVRLLFDQPLRSRERAVQARVRTLRIFGPWRRSVKAIAELAYPRVSERSLLELLLRSHRGRWRVVELYP